MMRRLRIIAGLAMALFLIQGLYATPADRKPMVVVIYADWCPLCQRLKPALAEINEKYNGKINFVLLDVTSTATTADSRLKARSLGLEDFFNKN